MTWTATLCFLAFTLLTVDMSRALFKITGLECINLDENFTTFEYCRLKAIRRNVAAISIKVKLHRIMRDAQIHIEILRRYNDYKPFLFNVTLDACRFMKNIKSAQKSFPIAALVYNILRKSTNVNHTCPYEDAFLVDNFYPEHKDLLLPLPSGDYLFIVKWSCENRFRTKIKAKFSFVEFEKLRREKKPKKGTSNRRSLVPIE